MNKIYISDNYIISEEDGLKRAFAKSHSEYDESVDEFILRKFPDKAVLEIAFIESGLWFNEAGDTAFTEATLRTFLRQNSGFLSGGTSGTGKIYKYTVDVFADLATVVDPQEGDIARVYNKQGIWGINQKNEGAYTYLSGVWEYGSRSLQTEILNNDADILAIQNALVDVPVPISQGGTEMTTPQDARYNLGLNSTALYEGGSMSGLGGTTLTIAAGSGYIVDFSTTEPTYTLVTWAEKTGIIPTNQSSWFAIDVNGDHVEFDNAATPITSEQRRTLIYLGIVVNFGGTIAIATDEAFTSQQPSIRVDDLGIAIGPLNTFGNTLGPNGTDLQLAKSAGRSYKVSGNNEVDKGNPDNMINAAFAPIPTGDTSVIIYTHILAGATQVGVYNGVDPDQYDNNGVLTNVGNNRWTVQRFWMFPNNDTFIITYGQDTYPTQTSAIDAAITEPTVNPSEAVDAIQIASIILKKGATDLSDTSEATFVMTAKFGGSGTSGGGVPSVSRQTVYENSAPNPETLTNSTNGADTWRRGSALESDDVIEVQNNAGTQVFAVTGEGDINVTGLVDGRDVAIDGAVLDSLTSSYSRRLSVIDIVDNTAVPPTEVLNDRYIIDFTGASNAAWDGASAGDIVEFNGTLWIATTPLEGYISYVDLLNKDALYVDDGIPAWEVRNVAVENHSDLLGLSNDDHTQYTLANGTRAFTGEQSMGTNKLTNVVNPTDDQDAATKNYVDTAVGTMLTETLTQDDGEPNGTTETSTISIDGMKLRVERNTNSLFKAQLLNETGFTIGVTFTRETFGQSNTVGFGSNVNVLNNATIQFEASAFWNVSSPDTVNVRFVVDGTDHYEASFMGTEIDPTKYIYLTFKKIN